MSAVSARVDASFAMRPRTAATPKVGWNGCLICGIAGGVLLSVVHRHPAPLLLSLTLCFINGLCGSTFAIPAPERRALYLSSGICALVAGIAQTYDWHWFRNVLGSSDGHTFLAAIESGQRSLLDIQQLVDTPLAVVIWQAAYRCVAAVNLPTGPWVAVLVNGTCIGWSALLTVKIAREVFGDDSRRLNQVAWLCAVCGVMWLFGALLLRDCFTLAVTNLCLWSYTRLVARGHTSCVLESAAITCLSIVCLRYLRPESSYGILMFGTLAGALWVWHYFRGAGRIIVLMLPPMMGLLGLAFASQFFSEVADLGARLREYYSSGSMDTADAHSLGVRFVVNQPLPIRVLIGSLTILVYPIPLWRSLQFDATAYDWIKNCHGLFMLWSVPAMATGCFIAVRDYFGAQRPPLAAFLMAAVSVTTLALVAATSLETRHHGQFIAAAIVVSAVPGEGVADRRLLGRVSLLWFGGVYAIHLLWLLSTLNR